MKEWDWSNNDYWGLEPIDTDAYRDGYKSYFEYEGYQWPGSLCCYHVDTDEYHEWFKGWYQAADYYRRTLGP